MTAAAYPLTWPSTRQRTPAAKRTDARFRTNAGPNRKGALVTLVAARKRLQDELDALRARDIVLSTNLELRLDGQPRAGMPEPADPGVALYFSLGKQPMVLCCDAWRTVAQNMAAIAAHIGALRGQERWGVATRTESFAGFVALPAAAPGQRHWREVLGIGLGKQDAAYVRQRQRDLAMEHHPDHGGDPARMAEINAAADAALREIGA